jgi:hypothetical protein
LLTKHIRKLIPDRDFVLGLAFWAAVLVFGWWYYYPALPSFDEVLSRITKPQTQGTTIKEENQIDGTKILSRTPFQGRCNQPGMIFQFEVKGTLDLRANGDLTNTGEVAKQQDVFTQYRYKPPDRIVLDLEDWLEAGKPAGRFSVPATEDDTAATAIHEIELDCEVDTMLAAAAQKPAKAALDTCWDEWVEKSLGAIPKPDDTYDPRTGKSLSQTPGAVRTRALKFQAAKDALQLRGKESGEWQIFLKSCVAR